mmetsp:Transcript_101162/g.200935  ORF Transcript_101162/g.200935 Transcript_101162/m.200935 type:complete len:684 (+) Transcript_101162:44-2095(+)
MPRRFLGTVLCSWSASASLPVIYRAGLPATTTSCQYDCSKGLSNWQFGWGLSKIEYCCKHAGVACLSTTTSCEFDCSVGIENWKIEWAHAKIEWCCKHQQVACPASTTTPCDYHCNVGLNNWKIEWAEAKRAWCCQHEQLGCPITSTIMLTTTLTTTTPGMQCWAASKAAMASWPQEKQTWCCRHRSIGCCIANPEDTISDWPQNRREWCCKNERVACPHETKAAAAAVAAAAEVPAVVVNTPETIIHCHLDCLAATIVELPGSVGKGGGASLNDVSLDSCRRACIGTTGCEAIVFTNHTAGTPFKSMCFGRRDIHTSKCQPGGVRFTEVVAGLPRGKCALFGDPHIISFDRVYGPPLTILSPGEYHLIKSPVLQVQGRFGYTRRFPTAASTVGIAIGGALIKGHTLAIVYVGPAQGIKGFKTFWDGREILQTYPSTFVSPDMVLSAKYDAMDPQQYHREGRHTIGGTKGKLPSFLFELGNASRMFLSVYVLIGPDNVNAVLTTWKVPGGQDGLCGNFNCNQNDDDLDSLQQRGVADPIPAGQSLFAHAAAAAPAWVMKRVAPPSLEECDPSVRAEAVKRCRGLADGGAEACIFDACATHVGAGPPATVPVRAIQMDFAMARAPQILAVRRRRAFAGTALAIISACGICVAVAMAAARSRPQYRYSALAGAPAEDGPLVDVEG